MQTQQELGAARDEKIAAEYRARNAVRVLDAWVAKTGAIGALIVDYRGEIAWCYDCDTRAPDPRRFYSATPDGARIAAAEALLKEDPSLGEGL